jgi:hypothetical protein
MVASASRRQSADAAPEPDAVRPMAGWLADIRVAVVPWLLARILVAGALGFRHYLVGQVGDEHPGVRLRQIGLLGWDAGFYKSLAIGGYAGQQREALRFFPLVPEFVHFLGLGGHAAGPILLVLVNVCALAYPVLLMRMLRFEGISEATIRRSAWLLTLAPTAFVLVMGYTEAIFGLLCVGTIYAARQRMWWPAAGCALLAGLTRPVGVLLLVPLITELILAVRARRSDWSVAAVAAVLSPIVGCVIYLSWVKWKYNDFLAPLHVQQEAGRHGGTSNPFRVLADAASGTFHGRLGTGLHLPWLLLFAALLVVLALRWPLSWTLWAAATLVATLIGSNLDSSERYLWGAFPFVVAAAGLLERKPTWEQSVYVLSAAGMVVYASLAFLGFYVP